MALTPGRTKTSTKKLAQQNQGSARSHKQNVAMALQMAMKSMHGKKSGKSNGAPNRY